MSFGFNFDFNAAGGRPRAPEEPMRILVLANLRGEQPAKTGLAERKIRRVDIDNFEDLLKGIQPTSAVQLGSAADSSIEVRCGDLDDFHPDQLYRNLEVFSELRDLRSRLMNPATFSEAVEKLRASLQEAAPEDDVPESPAAGGPPKTETDAETLDRILQSTELGASQGRSASSGIGNLINEIVAPYVVPGPDPRQDDYVQSVDKAVAGQLRAILHSSSFQSLESSWRSLEFLVTNVATCEELKVYVLDVTKPELAEAAETDATIEESVLFQRLITEREEEPWSLVVTDFSFGVEQDDLQLLGRLGAIAASAGGPLLGGANPQLLSQSNWKDVIALKGLDESADPNWTAFRSSSVAPWIGLAAPRFLLRLPYGSATDPLEALPFEEVERPQMQHESLLWGSPAIFCATLLGSSFLTNQWAMTPGDNLEWSGLPALTYKVDGEAELKPCAEHYIPERAAQQILEQGVMPLLSFKNRDAARLLRFQSIAAPARALSGPWS